MKPVYREKSIVEAGAPGRKARRSVTINEVESPLGWLFRHGHLSVRQYDAGEQLRSDYELSNLAPSVTMRWDASGVKGARHGAADLTPSERQAAARQRFDGALREAGTGMSDILWRIVCAGEGMRDAETALGWPARAGKLVLQMALDRVAAHYRIPE
ncbi:hypothetical protein GCM10022281_02060 [Sphingomonas rosea]|uniref:DUF6456 domain-containing protein n=1 Tax=Sphingomonas rosea TaxID=335605 RepID=A0ABP7TJ16_9SPHN